MYQNLIQIKFKMVEITKDKDGNVIKEVEKKVINYYM